MDTENFARLVYLGLLLVAVGGYFLIEFRRRPQRTIQQAILWGLIFLGTLAAVGLWTDIRSTVMPSQTVLSDGRIEAPLAPDGHYYLTAEINGVSVRFVVDTGATDIVLTRRDATRVGIDTAGLAYIGQARTANGIVRTAPVRLETMELGPIRDSNVRAVVNDSEMDTSLMGMTYLTRFARVELTRDRLVLER
ncbi:TIGR02281 family clan AA aspartic protease [Sedimentimonas flavescens]|uniref:retropepsin-like aspartic protease family protein n=1 Tax=Sedimentimonas flavescens TaxID=2851012 RepID=UPI001C4A6C01|nr:TIGR02281 family clan AA aspartic protease [Sedimentimonas flavescens]MBW0157388.1 TIGR02281 family clan AA aspartic protease [Sedimentimonas flavescens]WBL34294.1 TIGR02281 family clan AA aspartic protease [Sinirhodobacter sp. HNIBRBA609]